MYRSKYKVYLFTALLVLAISASGCLMTACSGEKESNKSTTKALLVTEADKEASKQKNDDASGEADESADTKVEGEITEVYKGDFEYEMFAIAHVKYIDTYYEVNEVQDSKFIKYNVAVGDKVKRGDVLMTYEVEFDAASLASQLAAIEQREREYTAGLDSRQAEINKAKHELSELMDGDEKEIKQLEIKKLKLALKEYRDTNQEIEEEKKEVMEYQSGAQSTELIAHCDGYVLSINEQQAEGDMLMKGQVMCVTSPKEEYVVEAEDSSDGTLRYNEQVTVSVASDDSSPDTEIRGVVISADNILSSSNIQGSAHIKLIDEPEGVNIENAIKVYYKSKKINDVLMVSSKAVLFESKGQGTNVEDVPYVYVSSNGETNKRYIEVFESNEEDYLILQGLKEGEKVVIQK